MKSLGAGIDFLLDNDVGINVIREEMKWQIVSNKYLFDAEIQYKTIFDASQFVYHESEKFRFFIGYKTKTGSICILPRLIHESYMC